MKGKEVEGGGDPSVESNPGASDQVARLYTTLLKTESSSKLIYSTVMSVVNLLLCTLRESYTCHQ